jgi:hypothetical protein
MKLKLTPAEIKEVQRLRKMLTNIALFKHINAQREECAQFGYTSFRTQLYSLKIFKCEMRRWTNVETKLLLDNYQTKGNIEIAKMLSKKGRIFTKKQVEKKMILLKITRTKKQLKNLVEAHKKRGIYSKANFKRWKTKKVAEGQTKVQIINGRPQVSIKVNGILKAYARVRYAQLHGNIAPGVKIYFKDMNPLNIADDNLIARKGSGLTAAESKLYKKHCEAYFNSLLQEKAPEPIAEPPKIQTQALIAVRINARTVVNVKPGTNIEKLKERYASRTIMY